MSTLVRAEVLGYCMGVRRAMEAAEKALDEHPGSPVYSLGPLIHNKPALEALALRGLHVLDDAGFEALCAGKPPCTARNAPPAGEKDAERPVLIIRAHGTTPEVRKKLEDAGIPVIDATCPRVLASQNLVKKYAEQNRLIIIAGDKKHGEVTALAGTALSAGAEYRVIQTAAEAASLAKYPLFLKSAAVLICQTTFGLEEYKMIKDILHAAGTDLKSFDTICPATEERQKALRALCKKVRGIVVVGGKDSANTSRLFQTAASLCTHAVHIERPEELPACFARLKTVGITAGASTPDELIRDVEKRFESFGTQAGDVS
ncbi:4-hydroxy-3-methylbut-2-enyl diphosphate reductase [Treponema sp. HNW]|uniref:4-hydroxy-3-methylbut-2-enyl diphosphate reductase n=1 Tax=Treponema sp. HNW TaxID=3116654 RepID=UPI003D0E56D5